MSDTSTLTSSVAGRYATALFSLAEEEGELEAVEADLTTLKAALADSTDLHRLIASPIYSRDDQARGMAAICEAMELGRTVRNLIGLICAKRRLFVLPELIAIYEKLMAAHRGEATAEVTVARALSEAQQDRLAEALRGAMERKVKINVTVDEGLIGGVVVKVGSRMIDTSIRSKLAGLKHAMKEVG